VVVELTSRGEAVRVSWRCIRWPSSGRRGRRWPPPWRASSRRTAAGGDA